MTFTKDNLTDAIQKCLANAQELINDAQLLKQYQRKERAYTLFQLASEEVGKAIRIFGFLLFEDINDDKSKKSFLKDFRNHLEKTKKSISLDFIILLVGKDQIKDKLNFLESTQYEMDNVGLINDLKNFSLYTSMQNESFLTPKELIFQQNLTNIEFRTLTRFGADKTYLELQLKTLDELKEYMRLHPIDINDKDIPRRLWEMLD